MTRIVAPLLTAAIAAVLIVGLVSVSGRLHKHTATTDQGPVVVSVVRVVEPPSHAARRTVPSPGSMTSRTHHPHHHCTAANWQHRLKPAERWIDQQESHLNPLAVEPSTHAYGIGQLLPSTYTALGLPMSPDPCDQIRAQRAYLQRHYGGSWRAALTHKRQTGWW